jgi:hypothetical protein
MVDRKGTGLDLRGRSQNQDVVGQSGTLLAIPGNRVTKMTRQSRLTQGETMPARTIYSWAILGVALTACGCGSTGVVTRGQDAHAPAGEVHDHSDGQQTSYYSDGNGMRERRMRNRGANCPQESHYCPPQGFGGACPHGVHGGCPQCNGGGGGLHGRAPDWTPTHHKTYAYSVPDDLSYPEQNAVGGAIKYPYYTHKGPSDFFRQK